MSEQASPTYEALYPNPFEDVQTPPSFYRTLGHLMRENPSVEMYCAILSAAADFIDQKISDLHLPAGVSWKEIHAERGNRTSQQAPVADMIAEWKENFIPRGLFVPGDIKYWLPWALKLPERIMPKPEKLDSIVFFFTIRRLPWPEEISIFAEHEDEFARQIACSLLGAFASRHFSKPPEVKGVDAARTKAFWQIAGRLTSDPSESVRKAAQDVCQNVQAECNEKCRQFVQETRRAMLGADRPKGSRASTTASKGVPPIP